MAKITVRASRTGFASLLEWARSLDEERQFAIEDCRHVSGPLDPESFRLGRWFLSAGRLHLFTPLRVTSPPRFAGVLPTSLLGAAFTAGLEDV